MTHFKSRFQLMRITQVSNQSYFKTHIISLVYVKQLYLRYIYEELQWRTDYRLLYRMSYSNYLLNYMWWYHYVRFSPDNNFITSNWETFCVNLRNAFDPGLYIGKLTIIAFQILMHLMFWEVLACASVKQKWSQQILLYPTILLVNAIGTCIVACSTRYNSNCH